ncbi:MAG TPA: carboxypeptidase-like regulatory domain-containing protein [Salinimicrobium sp.]|nr:carboxypeptidase-like regulatory domain-containing protein [Salinimicrobium sp.]
MKVSKFKLRCTSFFFLFISFYGFSQTVSGILKDEKTEKTIPYATVSIGENYGVITNDEGEFQINISGFNESDSLSFSSMGYEKHQIAIKDFNSETVYLKESLNELDNVYIIDRDLDPVEIMEKVNERFAENYEYDFQKFIIFRRSKTYTNPQDYGFEIKKADFIPKKTQKAFNKSIDSLSEKSSGAGYTYFNDFLAEVGMGKDDSVKVNLQKYTRLINTEKENSVEKFQENIFNLIIEKLQSPHTFKIRTGIIPIDDSLDLSQDKNEKNEFLVEPDDMRKGYERILASNKLSTESNFEFINEIKKYAYKIEDITEFNGEMVYVISFNPDRGSADYQGELYISAESFAILKMNYQLMEGETSQNVNLKFLLGFKFYEDEKSGTIIFQKSEQNKYIPKFIKTHSRKYTYFNRSFVLKENHPDRKKGFKLKFEILAENIEVTDNEILFVDTEKISQQDFDHFEESGKVPIEIIEKYDPKIWEDYNIIAPTQAIKEFEF